MSTATSSSATAAPTAAAASSAPLKSIPTLPLNNLSTQRRLRQRMVLMVVIPVAVLVIGGVLYLLGGGSVETDNAYVKADMVPVSAEVYGKVQEVFVAENQNVAAGQPLFRLDDAPFKVAEAGAEAKLAQVRADIAATRAAYRGQQAEIALARSKYQAAAREQKRIADLVANHFVASSQLDNARDATTIAQQQVQALEEDLKRIGETLGGGPDTPVEQNPNYKAAQAALEQAQLDLARVEVRASLPGTVSNPPKPGQFVSAGASAMALVVSGNPWVEANFPETDLTYMHPGQPVTIRVDTYPDAVWRGKVDSVSPATGAEFAVIPPQNATGNWVKITQRVPVRIKLESLKADNNHAQNAPELRAGLSARVEIETGHRRHLLGISL
jgi:membrane fusion protein (multidrug efflux system)